VQIDGAVMEACYVTVGLARQLGPWGGEGKGREKDAPRANLA
jgi:hypothetical protein